MRDEIRCAWVTVISNSSGGEPRFPRYGNSRTLVGKYFIVVR